MASTLHIGPEYPGGQLQVKKTGAGKLMQVAPFKQGMAAHSSMSSEQFIPVKPGVQVQAYVAFPSEQLLLPVMSHCPRGLGSQSSMLVWQNSSVQPGKQSHLKSLTRSTHTPFSHTFASQMLGEGTGVKMGIGVREIERGNSRVEVGTRKMDVNVSSNIALVVSGSWVVANSNTGVDVGRRSVSVRRKISVEVSGSRREDTGRKVSVGVSGV